MKNVVLGAILIFTWTAVGNASETSSRVIRAVASDPLVPPQVIEAAASQEKLVEAKILSVFEMVALRYRALAPELRAP